MNILITGATGYIGGKLVQRLLDKEGDNASIFVLVRGDSIPWDDQRICVVKGDLKDLSKDNFSGQRYDVVIHSAALMANKDYLPREEFRKTNVIGTKRLIESLEECEVKQFIQISTVGVYGSTGLEPVNEESGYGEKLSDYEWSKMEAEKKALECCQKLGIPLTILRLGLVYGENMAYGWPQMIDNVVKGRMRIIGKGNNRIQLSYIRDIVEGITRVIGNKRSCGVTLNLCGAQIYRIENIFYTIADILKVSRPPKVPFFPVYLLSGILKLIPESFKPKSIKLLTPHRVRFFKDNRVYNIKKAKEIMNFYPKYDLEEGMANTIKAHKEECYGK